MFVLNESYRRFNYINLDKVLVIEPSADGNDTLIYFEGMPLEDAIYSNYDMIQWGEKLKANGYKSKGEDNA